MSIARKPGRWKCLFPAEGAGYRVHTLTFPRCLPFWWRKHQLWVVIIHILTHFFRLDWNRANLALLKAGFLYCAKDGDILTWQWRFWHSSPLAREIKNEPHRP